MEKGEKSSALQAGKFAELQDSCKLAKERDLGIPKKGMGFVVPARSYNVLGTHKCQTKKGVIELSISTLVAFHMRMMTLM